MQYDSDSTGWDTGYEWKIILVLSLTFGLVGLDRFVLPVLFPAFMGELGLTYEDLGNLVGILAVFWGISAFCVRLRTGILLELDVLAHRFPKEIPSPHRWELVRGVLLQAMVRLEIRQLWHLGDPAQPDR